MVKSGSFTVGQGSLGARLGSGLGKGFGEQIPREVERQRLQQGLEDVGGMEGLSPFQQFAKLAGVPGITPQMLASGAELLRQQGYRNALEKQADKEKKGLRENPFIPYSQRSSELSEKGEKLPPSISTPETLESTLDPAIPKTREQVFERAGQLNREFPEIYANNPQQAVADAIEEDNRRIAINQALQQKRANQNEVQQKVSSSLENHMNKLQAQIPPDVASNIDDEATRAVLPKSMGGEGLTEQQAMKKYGAKADEISREYANLANLGGWSIPFANPKKIESSINNLRDSFEKRGDLRNFKKTLINEVGLSPEKAAYAAYPIDKIPELKKTYDKLPDVKPKIIAMGGSLGTKSSEYNANEILTQMSPLLAKQMGVQGSPLSIAQNLEMKGYDPEIFLDYLRNNKKNLNLTTEQIEELSSTSRFLPRLADIFLFTSMGKKEVVD